VHDKRLSEVSGVEKVPGNKPQYANPAEWDKLPGGLQTFRSCGKVSVFPNSKTVIDS
jgi:hypothetical protein